MKQSLLNYKNERGFYLPFVLFVALIVFSTITTAIIIYQNELAIEHQLWEQIKSETIAQMAVYEFKNGKQYLQMPHGTIEYEFPPGKATVEYEQRGESHFKLQLSIETDTDALFKTHMFIQVAE